MVQFDIPLYLYTFLTTQNDEMNYAVTKLKDTHPIVLNNKNEE